MKQMGCALVALFFSVAWAFGQSSFADFPFRDNSSISPDGSFTLKMKDCRPNQVQCDKRLWMVNNRTSIQKALIDVQRTARVGWAPSGSAFFLNDDFASNVSCAYLYIPGKDKHFDLGKLLDRAFPDDRHFEDDSHHYINGVQWISIDTVLVKRGGHFNRYVPGGNEFAVCYSVSTTGKVLRLSETHQESSSCKVP